MRKDMLRTTAIVLGVLIAASAFHSCSPEERDPARKALSAAMKAMGGETRLKGWTSRVERGTLTSIWPGWGTIKADCTQYAVKPDKMLLDQDYSAYDHPFYMVYTLNGDQAWQEVNMGIRQNDRVTQMLQRRMRQADGIPYFLENSDSIFIDTEVPDDSLFASAGITRVCCIEGADTVMFDISKETSLPVRRVELTGGRRSDLIMSDYRETAGRKLPFDLKLFQNGTLANEYKWESIEFDVKVDPSIFEKNRPGPEGS